MFKKYTLWSPFPIKEFQLQVNLSLSLKETSIRKCDWCKKDLNTGGVVLKSDVGKEYCSPECLGKWFTTQHKSEPASTSASSLSSSESSEKSSTTTVSSSCNASSITSTSNASSTSAPPATAVQTDALQSQTSLQSNPKIQKLLTLCSSANLLIPFPSICKDFTGNCLLFLLFNLWIS